MRHVGSLVLGLVFAPLIWFLTGTGLDELGNVIARGGLAGPADRTLGILLLVGAGLLVGVLLVPCLSPVGPAIAGLGLIAVTVWAILDAAGFSDAIPVNDLSFGGPTSLATPAFGPAILLAVPLVLTLLSPRRWRSHDLVPIYATAPESGAVPSYGYPAPAPAGYGAPAYPTPTPGAPGHGAPIPGAPGHGAPIPGAPGYAAPGAPTSGGPVPGSAPAAPAPTAGRLTSGAPMPPPPPQFTPNVPRQPAEDVTTRLSPPPPTAAAQPASAIPAPPPYPTSGAPTYAPPASAAPSAAPSPASAASPQDETTTLLPSAGQTTGQPAADEDSDATTVLPPSGSRPVATEPVDDGAITKPLRGAPPPPAAYPPPGHATPTSTPTDPDATRRL